MENYSNLDELIGSNMIDVLKNSGDQYMNDNIQSITFINAITESHEYDAKKKKLEQLGFTIYEFILKYMKALIFHHGEGKEGILVYAFPEYRVNDEGLLNFSIENKFMQLMEDYIQDTNMGIKPQFSEVIVITWLFTKCFRLHNNISNAEYEYMKIKNSQIKIMENYRVMIAPGYSFENFQWRPYDHLLYFTLFYFGIIKILSELYKNESDVKPYLLHDAGACSGSFAAMLSKLKKEEMMGVELKKIILTDLSFTNAEPLKRYLYEDTSSTPAECVELDLSSDNVSFPEADVTTIIDVLEHFHDEETSYKVFKRLWDHTKKALIVHVPYEEIPNPVWGHFISFNKEKLVKWFSTLSGGVDITDQFHYSKYLSFRDAGFMVIKKIV